MHLVVDDLVKIIMEVDQFDFRFKCDWSVR